LDDSNTISRRQLMVQAGRIGAGLAAASLPAIGAVESGNRPNFLVLLTDDQRWDAIGCAGNTIIRTPEIDRLAREGVMFENAFVTTAICAASRASILTGLYERTHGFTFGTPPLRADLAAMSYPAMLKAVGYRTGLVGKFGVVVEKGGVERMFDVFKPLDRNPYFKDVPGGRRHLTDIECDEAISFLRGCRKDQPFCLSVSFNAPHAEDGDPKQYFWPETVDHLYRDATIPVPKTATQEDFEKQPEFLRNSESRVRWRWRFDEPEKYQQMVRGYYRMISGVDAAIGRIRAELERQGLADDTIIIFMSDNGYFLGEHGFADKWLMYEESVRIPMIILDGGRMLSRPAGSRIRQMALNVDVAPTILAAADIMVPDAMQGIALQGLPRNDSTEGWRNSFFYEHLFNHKGIPKSEGFRTEQWAYMRYFEQKPVYEMLYDLKNDPGEENNLAGDPARREILEKMAASCAEFRRQYENDRDELR